MQAQTATEADDDFLVTQVVRRSTTPLERVLSIHAPPRKIAPPTGDDDDAEPSIALLRRLGPLVGSSEFVDALLSALSALDPESRPVLSLHGRFIPGGIVPIEPAWVEVEGAVVWARLDPHTTE